MIYSKICECVIILQVAIPQKWWKSVSDGLFFRVEEGFWEKKSVLQEVVLPSVEKNIQSWKKNNFGSLKNGCIFASAFAQKTGVEKKRQLFETDEKIEIACVWPYIKV